MAGLAASDEFIRERTVNGIFAYATDEPNVPTAWPKGECKKPDVATAGPFSKGKPVYVNRLEARFRLVMMTQEAKAWRARYSDTNLLEALRNFVLDNEALVKDMDSPYMIAFEDRFNLVCARHSFWLTMIAYEDRFNLACVRHSCLAHAARLAQFHF